MAIFQSNTLTIVDQTDNRKIEVYIKSNMPTAQIFNQNTGAYSPDWSSGLELTADVYLDSREIESYEKVSFQWSVDDGLSVTEVSKNRTYRITNNVLASKPILTYICVASYQNITATSKITFTRVDTGLNGTDGTPAPAVQAQYSVDGQTNWITTLNTTTHKYIRYSYDGGKSWTAAIKIVGEDGTSVNIKGTATSKTAISGTSYYTLVYNNTTITGAVLGDAYLLDGNMYVCVDSRDGNDYFMDVGHIQGPQGKDGQSSYVFIRYATDANGSNMSTNPSSTTTHIGICTVDTNVAPTTVSSYTWSKFVGDNAKNIVLSGSAQVFKISKANVYTPSTISVTATQINTAITEWTYSINGGQTFLSTAPTGVVRNGNIVTVTGSTFASNSLVIKASDGQYSDVFTIYKAFDGTDGTPGNPGSPASTVFLTNENISFSANASGQVVLTSFTTNVVAYTGTTKVTPTVGTITGLPSGMTVSAPVASSNEQILTFSIANNSNLGSASSNNGTITIPITSPVSTNLKLSWSKINTGATGVGISSTTVAYGVSDSSSTQPTEWKSAIPEVEDGKYLWTRTVIDYTDPARADTVTYTYAKQGTIGAQGNPGTSVAVTSIQYQEGSSATTAPNGTWQNAVVAVADGKYLWTKTAFSDGKVAYGVAKQGEKGNTGDDAYTVILTNESNTFVGDISNALAGQTTTQVLAYKKAAKQTVTISTVNGVAASTSATNTGIAGLTFQCSALSGTEPTITFKCTTAFVSPNGTIPIVLNVGGISFTKMFTYSIAFKGATGGQGNPGNPGSPATSYWLMSSASVVQKNASGTVVLTPSTLTFTGKSQTGTSAPIDYGCRWIIAYSTDGSTYTNAYTSSANEATKTFTVDSTYKTIRVRMYLAGGTTTLLDEQIIPIVTDGAIGTPGADAVTFQIYSSNGYALSINTPTVMLQTFAYIGDVAITAGATYQWYIYNTTGWTAISGATNSYLTITRDDVVFSKSYMCKMTFDDVEYASVATIDDKNDENKVFTTKPSNYVAGDIWIVGVDYVPSGIEVGTLLKAEHTSSTYEDADWIDAVKYDGKLKEIQNNIDTYNQYFSFDSTAGLKISAKNANGTPSQFSTSLTNERLSFNYGNEAVAYIDGKKMNIKEANIESPLTVSGKYSGSTMLQAPIINIGNFSIVVESNGSLSIVANV